MQSGGGQGAWSVCWGREPSLVCSYYTAASQAATWDPGSIRIETTGGEELKAMGMGKGLGGRPLRGGRMGGGGAEGARFYPRDAGPVALGAMCNSESAAPLSRRSAGRCSNWLRTCLLMSYGNTPSCTGRVSPVASGWGTRCCCYPAAAATVGCWSSYRGLIRGWRGPRAACHWTRAQLSVAILRASICLSHGASRCSSRRRVDEVTRAREVPVGEGGHLDALVIRSLIGGGEQSRGGTETAVLVGWPSGP